MKYEYFIEGVPPSKKNSKQIFKSRRTGKPFIKSSESHTSWSKTHVWSTRSGLGALGLKRCSIELVFWSADKHKFDLTNKAESIMDLLVDAGVIEDDNYSVVPEVTLRYAGVNKDRPGCLIIVDDLKDNIEEFEQIEMEI